MPASTKKVSLIVTASLLLLVGGLSFSTECRHAARRAEWERREKEAELRLKQRAAERELERRIREIEAGR
jgi:hypothetical protein